MVTEQNDTTTPPASAPDAGGSTPKPPPLPSFEDETDDLLARAAEAPPVEEVLGAPRTMEETEDGDDAGLLPRRTRARAKKTVDMTPELVAESEMQWYVLHAHSGHENRVRLNLLQRIKQAGLEAFVPEALVPSEEVAEIKGGKKRVSRRKSYPGYVFVRMQLTNDVWMLVKSTQGVTGFLGSKKKPTPLPAEEMEAIFEEIRSEKDKPKPKVMFEIDEQVKIIEGPFANFTGYVDDVNAERGRLKVLVEVFERRTPVECEFWQVEKI